MKKGRRRLHIATEALSMAVAVPFLLWASAVTPHPAAKAGLRVLAIVTALVDGYLLTRWRKQAREARELIDGP